MTHNSVDECCFYKVCIWSHTHYSSNVTNFMPVHKQCVDKSNKIMAEFWSFAFWKNKTYILKEEFLKIQFLKMKVQLEKKRRFTKQRKLTVWSKKTLAQNLNPILEIHFGIIQFWKKEKLFWKKMALNNIFTAWSKTILNS